MNQVHKNLSGQLSKKIRIIQSDKYPNKWIYDSLNNDKCGNMFYEASSINASSVPSFLKGFRTMFSAIHHFDSDAAKSVIQDAVNAKEGIGIFDGGDKSIFFMLVTILFSFLNVIFVYPVFLSF